MNMLIETTCQKNSDILKFKNNQNLILSLEENYPFDILDILMTHEFEPKIPSIYMEDKDSFTFVSAISEAIFSTPIHQDLILNKCLKQ